MPIFLGFAAVFLPSRHCYSSFLLVAVAEAEQLSPSWSGLPSRIGVWSLDCFTFSEMSSPLPKVYLLNSFFLTSQRDSAVAVIGLLQDPDNPWASLHVLMLRLVLL